MKNNDQQPEFNESTPPLPPPVPAEDVTRRNRKDGEQQPKKRKWLPFVGYAALVLVGFGIGSAAQSDTDDNTMSSEVQESEASPEVVTEEVEVAKQSCLAAVDHADELIEIYSAAFISASDALSAYQNFDYAGMDSHTADIEAAHGELTGELTQYYLTSGECRSN